MPDPTIGAAQIGNTSGAFQGTVQTPETIDQKTLAPKGGAEVSSVFGRAGAVVAAAGDYPSALLPLTVVTKAAAYAANSGDTVLANAAGGAFAVTLPAPVLGAWVTVKKTDASANAVTITQHAAEKIDGANTIVIGTQYEAATVASDGVNWFVVAQVATVIL